jgi:DNA repair exonuclease SbcCD ATPase subunit
MRLLSATVRNYRLHQDLTVDFDPARTLIGGPNESGKSTLIQAIHRGLFLKATVAGKVREEMVSNRFNGRPEVEIRFQARGGEYELAKKFSGPSGTTRLTKVGGQIWQGEEAQTKLAELLGVPEAGRVSAGTTDQQWGHLGVWQGESGEDPARELTCEQTALLQQLQRVGGAAAMQSMLDGRVAARFARARSQILTAGGAAKAGSDLYGAQAEVREAEAALTTAQEKMDTLGLAVQRYLEASATIERTFRELALNAEERKSVDEKIDQAEDLERREATQSGVVSTAKKQFESLDILETRVGDLRASIGSLRKTLTPLSEAQQEREAESCQREKDAKDAERSYEDAAAGTRATRVRRDLSAAYVRTFKARERAAALGQRWDHVQVLVDRVEGLRRGMAELPAIEPSGLKALQDIESGLVRATAALSGMATEVEVVESAKSVRLDEVELGTGESRVITDSAELTVEGVLHLRIRPGGANSLASAREEVRTLEASLRRSLDEHGLDSTAQASQAVARRDGLKTQKDAAQAALKEWDPENLAASIAHAREEVLAAEAELGLRQGQVSADEGPDSLPPAEAWLALEEELLESAEFEENRLKASRDTLRDQVAQLQTRLDEGRAQMAEGAQAVRDLEVRERMLVDEHGDDTVRAQSIEKARQAKDGAEAELARIKVALEELQPEFQRREAERLLRVRDTNDRLRQQAQTDQAVSQTILHSEGTTDPKVVKAQAEVRLESAREQAEIAGRKARAITLLDSLFQSEQKALACQYTKPLADKITSYLQCLFIAARAEVEFADGFDSCKLVRPHQPAAEDFATLSGGTREQVAAAVRLAAAELLSADHDGCLPLVFDDAFAYSDPDRVRTLQRMLDLGAAHGLQIIVVTCNPADYASLGARQVILS